MIEAEGGEHSKLKGTLGKGVELARELEHMASSSEPPTSKLRSTLVNKEAVSTAVSEGETQEVGEGTIVTQRDTGNRWHITRVAARERDGKVMANLTNLDGPGTLTMVYDDLKAKLEIEGSPWTHA
jgi:hypothetical protein